MWGLIGGILGAAFGAGSALIAVYIEGASWTETPYPAFFAKRKLLTVGMGFLVAALLLCRRSRYPCTDGFGALLLGTILSALASASAFIRLIVVLRGG